MDIESLNQEMCNNKQLTKTLRQQFKQEYYDNQDDYHKDDYQRVMDDKNDWHCWRYLDFYGYDVNKALDNMKSVLKWRHNLGVNEMKLGDFAKEMWLFSPLLFCGHDKDGNLMVFLVGKNYFAGPDSEFKEYHQRYLAFILDTIDRTRCITKKVIIVFDETSTKFSNIDLSISSWLVGVRNNWPNRIGAILIVGVPYLVQPLIRLVISWLPNEFRQRVFCGTVDELVRSRLDEDQVPQYLGGPLGEDRVRMASPGFKWAKDLKMLQNEDRLKAFNKWIEKGMPDIGERKRLIKLQMDYDALARSSTDVDIFHW